MTEWRDLELLFAGHWVYPLAIAPLVWAAVVMYRRTRPAPSPRLRWTLTALRCLSLSLVLGLVAEPVVTALTRRAARPSLALLLDTSRSMAIAEVGHTRLQQAMELAGDGDFRSLLRGWDVVACGFSERAYPVAIDTVARLVTGGQATDLAGALETCDSDGALGARAWGAALLLSDGAHNLGVDPLEAAARLGCPVHSLLIGSEVEPVDLQVAAATAPPPAYAGDERRLAIRLRHWGFAGRPTEVVVWEGDRRLASQPVTLSAGGGEQEVVIRLPPAEPGLHLLRVQVPVQEGEQAAENNQALVMSRVRRSRIEVLLVAAAPGPEFTFLRRALVADSSLAVRQIVGGVRPVALDAGILEGARAIVLVDPDARVLEGAAGQVLVDFVRTGGGLLLVTGPRSLRTWKTEAAVGALLPLALGPGEPVAGETSLRPLATALEHPILRHPEESDAAAAWERLPPVAGLPARAATREGAQVLLASEAGQPVVAVGGAGAGRVVVAAAVDFWRLDLMSSGAGGDPRPVRHLWQSALRWLASGAPEGRVRAATERAVFRAGSPVRVVAEVYDELMRPHVAARVEATLATGDESVRLEPQGGGRYGGSWLGLAPGQYRFVVRAHDDGATIGSDEGQFVVDGYSLESMDVRARPELLAELAAATDGLSLPLQDWRNLAPRLDVAPRLVEARRRWSFWGHGWALVLVLGLLGAEWVIRKRQGML